MPLRHLDARNATVMYLNTIKSVSTHPTHKNGQKLQYQSFVGHFLSPISGSFVGLPKKPQLVVFFCCLVVSGAASGQLQLHLWDSLPAWLPAQVSTVPLTKGVSY